MSIKSFLRQVVDAKHFADLNLSDGTRVRVPGDQPAEGDSILRLDGNGTPQGPLPDGTYHTTSGFRIAVRDGHIESVTRAGDAAAPEEQRAAELANEVQRLNRQLEEQSEAFAAWQQGPAEQPAPTHSAYDRVHVNTSPSGRSPQPADLDDVAEAIRMIRYAKQGHPEYRFNRANAKKYAVGKGVNFNNLLERCPDIAPELFHAMVVEEGVAQHFNVLDVNVNGSANVTVELPTLDDTTAGTYLEPGIDCAYTATGETVLNKRTMDVNPWHYYREYCPKEWGNSFRGLAYVNDEELPHEAVILEFLFSKIRQAWEQTILTGDTSGSAPFDGLLTQISADASVPAPQQVVLNPTATDAVSEFEKLLAAVPPELFANVLDEPLVWFTPNQHLEHYVQNYRATFQSLPYNNRFEKFGPDSALKRANFVNTSFLTDNHILTAASNLFLGIGKDMEVDVQFHDAGKEQYLFVRVEGHTGVGYPLSEQVLLGKPV